MQGMNGEAASPQGRVRGSQIEKWPVLLFCGGTFLFWASLYIYVPILPVYAAYLGASMSAVGLVVGSYGIAQLWLRIPLGIWSDWLGRRKFLVLAGLGISALAALGLGLSPNVWWLFLSRTTTGIAAATWVVFAVLFSSYFPQERTAMAMSLIVFVSGVAQMVASYAGGVIAETWGWQATFFSGGGLALAGMLLFLKVKVKEAPHGARMTREGLRSTATEPTLLLVSLLAALIHFATWGTSFAFVPIYATQIGASRADLGLLMMLVFASATVASLLASWVAGRWGYQVTVVVSSLLMGAFTVVTPWVSSLPFLVLAQIGSGLGRGLGFPLLMALSIETVPAAQRATAMGVFQAVYSLGILLGPTVSGQWADTFGLASVFYLGAAFCLLTAALAWPSLPKRVGSS